MPGPIEEAADAGVRWEREVEPVSGDASLDLYIGRSTLVVATSPRAPYAVVFEDDGVAGVLYGLDRRRGEGTSAVLDGLLVYQVAQGQREQGQRNRLDLVWTEDGRKVVLLINGHAHAFFAFDLQVAAARSGQPPAHERGYTETHDWQPSLFARYWPAYARTEERR